MAMQSLWTGLSGLQASSGWLDRVGDNLANLNTVGYAQDQGTFEDALTMQLYGSATDPGNARRTTPAGWRGGTGVQSVSEGRDFDGMNLQQTGNDMDFAIQGPGFFKVQGPSGPLYTKAGNFIWSRRVDGSFQLATQNGYPVLSTTGQPIIRPANGQTMSVGQNGQVSFGNVKGPQLAIVEIGQPSSHLAAQGNNLYALTAGGTARPAQQSSVQQGYLSYSNVDESQMFADMMEAQQSFQLNSESISITNQMMGVAATIRS
ncbi:flagellar hook-basal body protein [Alicyclobacillus fastidiosus]|uniref:Flagellar hook-basal body protein n=1 Tax=Alicyclobacillus fastidiosus TaxID=392011 RepID=A0ABY6ZH48_9BACL|nr:flagellar hook-basal body protein [Alicyclobacillus fastidiosus]WAH41827.1 flagellar hook-basal body protein [Alicyclobacillus fastidiosus]GMA63525.1 flagellar basal-body rod protein FlgG [Alicyclobacillus fastidiosus]